MNKEKHDSSEEQELEELLQAAIPAAGKAAEHSNAQLMFEMGRAVG